VGHFRSILRLATEAGSEGGVFSERRFEELDRNAPPEPGIDSRMNVGHSAAPEQFAHVVPTGQLPNPLRNVVDHELPPA